MRQERLTRTLRSLFPLTFYLIAACQQDMAAQPSYKPLDPSSFFPDGRSARPLVAGTVARGHLRTDEALFTGKTRAPGGNPVGPGMLVVGSGASRGLLGAMAVAAAGSERYVEEFPLPIDQQVLERGFQRYMIYCVVCHDPLGEGHGKIVERGYTPPPSYHIDRLRQAPVGHLFDVITNGYGSMPEYRQQIPVRDRWAIVAYIRALQLSQHFPEKDLTKEMRQAMESQPANQEGGERR